MRILHIRIENFGTISNYDLDCTDGLNVVMHANGWGKTTLAAFIRAMFYGLEGGRKRDYAVNDRMRYQPWNKGFFGGEITFEVNGKKYVLNRDFGTKDADGTFQLFDGVTGLPSKDFTENIGVELFGIDSESYRRTGFIDHNMIKYDGVNSTISSKVSTLSQTNDLNNFDKVDADLKDYLNSHSPKKKTGALYLLNEEIQTLNQECKKATGLNAQLDDLQKKKTDEQTKESELKKKRDDVLAKQRDLGEKKSKITSLQALHRLHEETVERKNDRNNALNLFGGALPEREAPGKLSKLVTDAMNRKSALDQTLEGVDDTRYERLTKYFKDSAPSEEEVQKAIDDFSKVKELIKKNDTRSTDIESKQKTAENLRQANPQPTYRQLEANILFAQQKYQEAYDDFIELTNSNLRSAEIFYAAARCKEMQKDTVAMLALLDSTMATFSKPYLKEAAPYLWARAEARRNVGKYRDAITDMNEYETLMSATINDNFYYIRHQTEIQGRLYQQALNDINRAIQMNPQEILYYAEKSSLEIRVGMYEQAIQTADECIKLDSNNSDGYLFKGLAQCLKGDKAEGIKNLTKAKDLGDTQADALIEKYK